MQGSIDEARHHDIVRPSVPVVCKDKPYPSAIVRKELQHDI
jgi:hypothetical protein